MNTGQTMISAAFLVLITMLFISSDRMLIEGETTRLEGQAINLASDLAYSLIREAMSKKFDEDAVTTYYQYASEFTPTSKLGPSSSEVISPLPDRTPYKSLPRFDDFDDYNGYERVADTPTIKGFLIKSKVYYVEISDFSTKSKSQTYFKKIDVSVEHPQYLKSVTFSSLMTY